MSSGWPEPRIGDVGTIVTGSTPSSKTDGNWGNGAAFLTPSDMPDVAYVVHTERRLSAQRTSDLASRLLPSGAVAVSCIASIGKVARITEPTVTNQQVNSLIPDRSVIDANFAFYWLRTLVPQLHQIASGSVAKIVNKTDFSNLTLPLPDMTEQRRIAGVLGALDDLIEVNRGLMAALDEMAAAQAGRWIQSSDLKVRLSAVADHLAGKYLAKDKYEAGGQYVVYGSNSIMGTHSEFLHRGPLTVLARIGSFCGALAFSEDCAWINNNASAIRAKRSSDAYWLHRSLLSVDMDMHRAGSGQPFVRIESLMNAEIPWLSPDELESANRALGTLERAIAALHAENSQLASTRDELLPLLMSGRVRVVEEVAA